MRGLPEPRELTLNDTLPACRPASALTYPACRASRWTSTVRRPGGVTLCIYPVYPRSFAEAPAADGTHRGIGDLAGIRSHLDHLAWLGVDAIWLSPFYPSPMKDFGYDVSEYCDVDPAFGTLDDLDALVDAAHGLGLRVVIDFVLNHTSDQHPWFVESPVVDHQPQAGLVPLARSGRRRVTPERLDGQLRRRVHLAGRRDDRPGLPAPVPARAGRPQLGPPRGGRGDARRRALLVGPRHRRVPAGRGAVPRQGPGVPARTGLASGPARGPASTTTPAPTSTSKGCAPSPMPTPATRCWSARCTCPTPTRWRSTTARTTSCTWRSTSLRSSRRGTRRRGGERWNGPRPRSTPSGRGPRGPCPTTTTPATAPATGASPALGRRPCYC